MSILIIVLVIVGLSLLILGHEAGHFFMAKIFGLRVDEFGFGFPPRIKAWKKGETEYSLNWLPFGGFVRINGERGELEMIHPEPGAQEAAVPADASRSLYARPAWKKSLIMLAGVFMNFIFGWLFLSITLMVGAPRALVVGSVEANSPAAQAGVAAGDIIKGYTSAQAFIDYVGAHKGEPTQFTFVRNNKDLTLSITPRAKVGPDQGAIGVGLAETGAEGENFFRAIWDGLRSAAVIIWLTILAFYNLFRELFVHATLLPGAVGPVGIFSIAEETGKIGLAYLLQFMGIVSLNLTVVNLIPFPALDGGRFVMAIVEKIKGSALSYKVEAWINGIGFAILLLLMVLLTVRDIQTLL